jgi:hypothetical protein
MLDFLILRACPAYKGVWKISTIIVFFITKIFLGGSTGAEALSKLNFVFMERSSDLSPPSPGEANHGFLLRIFML